MEIMIAVAIMATAFVVLLTAQSNSFLSSERGTLLTSATLLARQKMGEIELDVKDRIAKSNYPDEEDKSGTFDEPFEDFRWAYKIRKVEIPVVNAPGGESSGSMEQSMIKNVMDKISKSVREIKLTIYWGNKDKAEEDQEQMSVTTHIVQMESSLTN